MTEVPTCQAKNCDFKASNEIDGILLDGTEYSVYTCERHHD